MGALSVWVEAARPRTLPASLAPVLVGTAAGYFGGAVDAVLMRLTDIFLAFPRLVLALAFVAALGPGIENAVIAIAITAWPPYARIARAETLTIRNSDFIAAVQLQGASSLRIIVKHVMPLCISSLIVRVTLDKSGVPTGYETIFADDGKLIGASSAAAVAGGKLLIGSVLDDKMLECEMSK